MRLLGEKMGVLGHVAFCESVISGENNVDIIYFPRQIPIFIKHISS